MPLFGLSKPNVKQQAPARHAEFGFQSLLIGLAIHDRNAVRNDPHAPTAHAVRAREKILGDLAHHHELHAFRGQFPHDRRLILGRVLEDGVQRNDGGHAQRVHEIEDVAAVVAAEDAVLVLDANQAHAAVVHELGSARVVGLDVLPNLELDLGRILVLAARFGDGQHHREHAPFIGSNSTGEIASKGGDSATTRTVRADERYLDLNVDRVARQGLEPVVCATALRASGVLVRWSVGDRRHLSIRVHPAATITYLIVMRARAARAILCDFGASERPRGSMPSDGSFAGFRARCVRAGRDR